MDQYYELSEMYDLLIPEQKGMIDFYSSFVRKKNFVLDVGCGTGRLAFVLEKLGAEVTAIDISSKMIEKAKKKAKNIDSKINFLSGDFLELINEKKYDYIFLSGGVFEYFLTPKFQRRALNKINKLLKDGGKLIFDTITPPTILPFSERKETYDAKLVMKISADVESNDFFEVDSVRQIIKTTSIFDINYVDSCEKRLEYVFHTRYNTPIELMYLLEISDFSLVRFYGEFNKSTFNKNSPYMIFICEKSTDRRE